MASWVLDINCVRISFQKCAGISCYHTNHGGIFFYVSAMELAQVAMVLGRCNSFFSNRFIISCVWLIITLPRSRQKIASAVIVIFIFIFFEIAQSKLGYYLLPLYPFMALSIALTLAPILKNSSNYRTTARVLAIAIGIYAAASAVLNIQAPQKRDLLLRYSDAVTTRDIALDEKYIGKFLAREKIPVYLYKWPYHETLYYYGNAPELITVTQSKQPTDPPYFLVIPTDFVTSNQVRFNSVSVEFIYQGPIGTLFRTKN